MMIRKRVISVVGTVAILAFALAGYSSVKPTAASGDAPTGSITVLAASSLTQVFNSLGSQYQKAHPGTNVKFSYASSATLAAQIVEGAPADVFAAASPKTMMTVTDAKDAAGTPVIFARNQLVIAVAPGNPKNITSLADLTKPGLKVVLCDKTAPCGAAAVTALAAGGVKLTPASYESDAGATVTAVELGEADAALVYRTDVQGSNGKAEAVAFPESAKAINDYPIVALDHSKDLPLADSFVSYVDSPPALAQLEAAGFLAP
jgi:molybdate transport system substrate-binding protein